MDYFKHYANASEGKTINQLEEAFGLNGYAWWFKLVELCAAHWDGKSAPEFRFHQRIVRQKLRISLAKVQLFLDKCSTFTNLSHRFSENFIEISMPKLLEVKTSRSVIKNNKKQLTVYKNRIEENRIDIVESQSDVVNTTTGIEAKNKNARTHTILPEFSKLDDEDKKYLGTVNETIQRRWLADYRNHAWICEEIHKAVTWMLSNPGKRTVFSRFMNNWLSRGKDKMPYTEKMVGDMLRKLNEDCFGSNACSGPMEEIE